MNDHLLKLYHHLPSIARTIVASARGYYLRSWRYGAESERLIEAAIERESWSAEKWQKWQSERIMEILHRAATRVPYYRRYWEEQRRNGNRTSSDQLQNWPILAKESVRENPLAFVADDCDPRVMFREHTSGTSGKALDLWWSRETVRAWYALFETRARRWHYVSRDLPWGILGGQPIAPANVRKPPFWVWNAPMHQLYLSANHLSRHNAPYYLEALEQYGITHLISYPSSAAMLAAEAQRLKWTTSKIKVVITNAEPLTSQQRDIIHQGLGCHPRETYGMAEIVAAASECQQGNMHLWPEVGYLERLQNQADQPAQENEPGRLICTGLLNADMPLIRYQVGDRIGAAPQESACPCHRTLPLISRIEGRINDVIIAPDGRHVYWLNPVFYGLPIYESQIIQERVDLIRIRFVPASQFNDSHRRIITERLRMRLGKIEVMLEPVTEIPREANGKFRAVISSTQTTESR